MIQVTKYPSQRQRRAPTAASPACMKALHTLPQLSTVIRRKRAEYQATFTASRWRLSRAMNWCKGSAQKSAPAVPLIHYRWDPADGFFFILVSLGCVAVETLLASSEWNFDLA